MAPNRRKAFTLIELLVVIAIIALLLAVIIPALKKAKSHARKLVGTSNLRSLSMAVHIYLNSNNDTFFDYGTGSLWMDSIDDLVDNIEEVKYCPETIAKKQELEAMFTGPSIWGESLWPWLWANSPLPNKPFETGSYGLNGWLYREVPTAYVPASDQPKLYKKRSSVRNPSKTPFILDANWVDAWPKNDNVLPATGYDYETGDQSGGASTNTTMIGRFIVDRHGPETNVIFLDGQVQTISHAALWTLAWHRGAHPNFDVIPPQPEPKKK